jgi:hypothetical protein
MTSPTPYVNEDGEVWIERGSAAWPKIQHEAYSMLDEMGWGPWDGYRREYVGIEEGVRVSDQHEYSHGDDDGCADSQNVEDSEAPGFVPCCRTITAHHFRGVER